MQSVDITTNIDSAMQNEDASARPVATGEIALQAATLPEASALANAEKQAAAKAPLQQNDSTDDDATDRENDDSTDDDATVKDDHTQRRPSINLLKDGPNESEVPRANPIGETSKRKKGHGRAQPALAVPSKTAPEVSLPFNTTDRQAVRFLKLIATIPQEDFVKGDEVRSFVKSSQMNLVMDFFEFWYHQIIDQPIDIARQTRLKAYKGVLSGNSRWVQRSREALLTFLDQWDRAKDLRQVLSKRTNQDVVNFFAHEKPSKYVDETLASRYEEFVHPWIWRSAVWNVATQTDSEEARALLRDWNVWRKSDLTPQEETFWSSLPKEFRRIFKKLQTSLLVKSLDNLEDGQWLIQSVMNMVVDERLDKLHRYPAKLIEAGAWVNTSLEIASYFSVVMHFCEQLLRVVVGLADYSTLSKYAGSLWTEIEMVQPARQRCRNQLKKFFKRYTQTPTLVDRLLLADGLVKHGGKRLLSVVEATRTELANASEENKLAIRLRFLDTFLFDTVPLKDAYVHEIYEEFEGGSETELENHRWICRAILWYFNNGFDPKPLEGVDLVTTWLRTRPHPGEEVVWMEIPEIHHMFLYEGDGRKVLKFPFIVDEPEESLQGGALQSTIGATVAAIRAASSLDEVVPMIRSLGILGSFREVDGTSWATSPPPTSDIERMALLARLAHGDAAIAPELERYIRPLPMGSIPWAIQTWLARTHQMVVLPTKQLSRDPTLAAMMPGAEEAVLSRLATVEARDWHTSSGGAPGWSFVVVELRALEPRLGLRGHAWVRQAPATTRVHPNADDLLKSAMGPPVRAGPHALAVALREARVLERQRPEHILEMSEFDASTPTLAVMLLAFVMSMLQGKPWISVVAPLRSSETRIGLLGRGGFARACDAARMPEPELGLARSADAAFRMEAADLDLPWAVRVFPTEPELLAMVAPTTIT